MPGRSGLEVMQTVIDEKLPCKIVILTAALHDKQVNEILQAGAKGFVLKESTPSALIECVRKVHHGETWVDGGALGRVLNQMVASGARQTQKTPLTARELEIVRMVGLGLRNREIGERLKISEGTVKIHLHHAYEKLGVDGRLELVLYAQEQGWI
jgi:DNA-binding NarL/FixJ family response regulator